MDHGAEAECLKEFWYEEMLNIRDRRFLLYLLFIFVTFSMTGWCTEVAFRSSCRRALVIPGFLKGPYCPIYGFGMAGVLLLCGHKNKWITFLRIFVLCSVLEYVVSFYFERVYHRLLWNYSGLPFSIGSRVCLLFSIMWGFFGTLILKEGEPRIRCFYIRHKKAADILTEMLLVIMLLDTLVCMAG